MTPKERQLAALQRAYCRRFNDDIDPSNYHHVANETYSEIRAVVRAVLPGTQNAKNTADAMDKAVRAVCRVIRRRA